MAKMVDRVISLYKNPDKVRNIAICAHIDHGKTTFSDNLLAGAGMMSEDLAGKACVLDFHADEQQRGITIDSSAVSMVHTLDGEDSLINLIDTPGHVDFGGDVTRAMRAVDGAVVLCCASEGIMPQTETVLRQALRERVKPILFINKVDRLIKELKLTPEAMQQRFVKIITHVNKLIREIADEEFGDKWQVNVMDGSVCFGSAYHNWALSIDYMKKKNITFKEIIDAYEGEGYKELKKKAPLHEVVLNAVIRHHPSPTQAQEYRIPRIWHGDLESAFGKSLLHADPAGPLGFVVVKVVVDPQAGEICMGRIYSGTMRRGTEVTMFMAKKKARIQQVYVYNGAKKEIVDNIPAGNIVGVGGLKDAYPGESVLSNEDEEPFEKLSHIFEPVISKAIEPAKAADLAKLIDVLVQVGKEDPSLKVEINQETGENIISGMGELHLEVIENRIKTEKGLDVKTSAPIVVYRETITGRNTEPTEGKSPNKHNKLYFTVEPLDLKIIEAMKDGTLSEGRIKKKDASFWEKLVGLGMDTQETRKVRDLFQGNMFVDATRGIVHMPEIIEMVLDMFEDVCKRGGLAQEPVTGMRVNIVDCKLHEDAIHRGPAQMYPAIREGIRDAMRQAKPLLLEPVQLLQIEAPSEYMGEISKLVSNKRGQLINMEQETAQVIVEAKMPVAEMFGWSSELRSGTGGRGSSFVKDQSFEVLPGEFQDKIKNQIRSRKGLTENQ